MKVDIEPKVIQVDGWFTGLISVTATSFRLKRASVTIASEGETIFIRDQPREPKTLPKGERWYIPIELRTSQRGKHKINVRVEYTDTSASTKQCVEEHTVFVDAGNVVTEPSPDVDLVPQIQNSQQPVNIYIVGDGNIVGEKGTVNLTKETQTIMQPSMNKLNKSRPSHEGEKREYITTFSRDDRRHFYDCLTKAYDGESLEKMLSFHFDKRLDMIAGKGDFGNIVFEVIKKAEREGWIFDLVEAAYQESPGRQELTQFREMLLARD